MLQTIEKASGADITVLQSIEMAVNDRYNSVTANGDCFSRDITVSQPIEISLGETLPCHSQHRLLLV